MIAFAVSFLAILILLRIPVVREITIGIVGVAIIAFLIAMVFAYSDARTERESRQGVRK